MLEPPSASEKSTSRDLLGTSLKTAGCALFAIVTVLVVLPCMPFAGIALDVYNSNRERERLLHATDHRALLAASRKLIRDCAGQSITDPAHDPRVPQIIRNLGPSSLYISDVEVIAELHGGFDHYGFIAFKEGTPPEERSGKLIDGLYYYSE
jgi:hypothetical protein